MTPRNFSMRGFTLIEISVVLILVALLASTVAVSSVGMVGGATHAEVGAQIGSLDTEARRVAKRLRRTVELHIDTDAHKLVLRDPQQPDAVPLGGYGLPRGYRLDRAWRISRDERVEERSLVVRYEPDGSSSTWGLSLLARDQESDRKPSVLMVLGITGQMTQWETDEQTQDILAAARRDVD